MPLYLIIGYRERQSFENSFNSDILMVNKIQENLQLRFPMKALLLKNKTSQLDKYDTLFKSNGFDPEFMPLLTHTNVTEEFLQLIESPGYLDNLRYIIITSQRTVECLSESVLPLLSQEARSKLLGKTIYTVGPVTKDFLKRVGFQHLRGGEDAGNGNVLADIIISDLLGVEDKEEVNEHSIHELLFLVGEVRRDIIPKKLSQRGINVREVVMYKTQNIQDNASRFQNAINNKCWVVFFSPQGTEGILKCLNEEVCRKIKIASIGPTTEEYLKSHGITPDIVSPKPDAENLLNAIRSYV